MLEEFSVSPEYCLIVRAFSRAKSLREAAKLLNCDPAALVRKAQKMASEQGLLQKLGGKWALTEKGSRAALWVEQSIVAQKVMMSEKPRLRISTTTWMAEQLLIPNFRALNEETKKSFTWSIQTGSLNFEADLLSGAADYVIACHAPSDPMIAHKKIAPESWVVIAPKEWQEQFSRVSTDKKISLLKKKPFIRHTSIVPEVIVGFRPETAVGDLLLDSLISVRAAVLSGQGWSCVPLILVQSELKQKSIYQIDIPMNMNADLCIWWLRARTDTQQNIKSMLKWLR